jgi:hypothetical protein
VTSRYSCEVLKTSRQLVFPAGGGGYGAAGDTKRQEEEEKEKQKQQKSSDVKKGDSKSGGEVGVGFGRVVALRARSSAS